MKSATHRTLPGAEHTTLGSLSKSPYCISIVTCLLKARIVESEETAVARQWLCKHLSMATKARDHRIRYTCNNRGTVRGGILC
jgi:hypothetical protein